MLFKKNAAPSSTLVTQSGTFMSATLWDLDGLSVLCIVATKQRELV